MDRPLVLIAKEGFTASEILAYIDLLATNYWELKGYAINEGITSMRGGIPAPEAARTTTWATIETAPDSTEYFSSLSNDSRFQNWKDYWINAGFPGAYEELELPEEWVIEGEL